MVEPKTSKKSLHHLMSEVVVYDPSDEVQVPAHRTVHIDAAGEWKCQNACTIGPQTNTLAHKGTQCM